uniref:Uncharacterized protein n=1 Tax=Knipowitschia caucasica TaxID=637954 RepID=A0AAV2JT61_KNICA
MSPPVIRVHSTVHVSSETQDSENHPPAATPQLTSVLTPILTPVPLPSIATSAVPPSPPGLLPSEVLPVSVSPR